MSKKKKSNKRPTGTQPATQATIAKARAEIAARNAVDETATRGETATPNGEATPATVAATTPTPGAKGHKKATSAKPKAKGAPKANVGRDGAKREKAKKQPKVKRVSALDAAAQVLAGSKEPMNAKDLIAEMETKGLWKSPGGKTPHATLYAAMLREITTKGREARFKKVERGMFASTGRS